MGYKCYGCGRTFRYWARSHVETRCHAGHRLSGRGRNPGCQYCRDYTTAYETGRYADAVRTKIVHPPDQVLSVHLDASKSCRAAARAAARNRYEEDWPDF